MKEEPKNANGKIQILSQLATSPDKWVQLGTLALVAVSGVTSTIQSNQLSSQQIDSRDKAVRQINELYGRLDEFADRQVKMFANTKELLEHNSKELENQGEILKILKDERKPDTNR